MPAMGASGHLSGDVAIRVSPCPLGRTLWVGWSWPELGLPAEAVAIAVPRLQAIENKVVTMRARPDESSAPPEMI